MLLKDLDPALFTKLTSNPKLLGYFVTLLENNYNSDPAGLKAIYASAVKRFPQLTNPVEAIAKEIESTLTAYCEINGLNDAVEDVTTRSLAEVIQTVVLPLATTDGRITFVNKVISGGFVK